MFKNAGELSTDSEEEYSEISGSELDEEITWIEWFCHLKGNEFFVEVDEDYIQDDFNLTGLSAQVPYYEHALNMILDFEDQDDHLPEDQQPLVETAAQMLYGLIHARFILTGRGMAAMLDKFNAYVYGVCPLKACEEKTQAVLPIGTSDILRQSAAKVYCPNCREIYFPRSPRLGCLDGAYFGSSFAHLFFLTYVHLQMQSQPPPPFVPRLYGFKIHRSVKDNLRKQKELQAQARKSSSSSRQPAETELVEQARRKVEQARSKVQAMQASQQQQQQQTTASQASQQQQQASQQQSSQQAAAAAAAPAAQQGTAQQADEEMKDAD
mmetsp:Transcript_64065/g.134694  ORF Transcript_64065/g.134694 Transcript_64065/m.134694 type:complete len:324 (+) Transcript_64065:294-1265(+)